MTLPYEKTICCLLWLFLGFFSLTVCAQVPYVKLISPSSARPQQSITIQGINFGTNASNIKVAFGAVTVVPQTITDQLIEVNVPLGTTYDNLGVLNTSTGFIGYSKDPFLMSFGGTNPFNTASVAGQFDFNSESGLYDFTMSDFDGDGKTDIATANDNSSTISLFLNTSSTGSVSFTKSLLTPGVISFHVTSCDLNGDSKPEILVSEKNGARVFIFKNTSTTGAPSFVMQTLTVTGAKVSQVKSKDMDLNGKADLVLTDQTTGRLFVVPNTSSLSTIQFGAPINIALPGSAGVDGIEVGDLNNDGLPDIVASEFLTALGNISVIQNLSSPGNFTFNTPQIIQATTTISNLRIGDLDGDAKPDLAATGLLANGVLVYKNQSTTAIQFASPVLFDANAKPWGIDFGDVDGDGKTDIIVASITQKSITVLNSQSTPGTFKFLKQTLNTTYINRGARIGDIDNDGRPDLVFTSIDDNNLGIPASKISVFRNLNCVVPVLSPNGPITVCSNLPQRLTASNNPGCTYEWFKDGVSLGAPSATSFYDATVSGSYKVVLANGACTQTSNAVQVTVVTASSLPTATPTPVPPVCVSGTLTLSVNNVGASDYVWTGPGSFIAHGLSVTRNSFQPSYAGEYDLEVMIGTCVTQRASIVVDIVDVPQISIITSGADIICQGQSKQLTAFPTVNGFNYQWAEQTSGNIGGATSSSYNATTSGSYIVKLTSIANGSCPPVQSSPKSVRVAQIPAVDFLLPTTSCVGQQVSFTNQTLLDPDTVGLGVKFAWDFGDNTGTSSSANTTYTYAVAQTFNVKLSVSYLSQSCLASAIKSIAIQNAPTLAITTPSGIFKFCPTDSLQLQATVGFDSYLWSNGQGASSIYVKSEGTFSVDVTIGSCKISTNKTIALYPAPNISISANPTSIKEGGHTNLTASGLLNYIWTPGTTLSDSLISNPIATPPQNTTYTVSGKDNDGCIGIATISIGVSKDNAVSSLIPSNFFSPNGDTINDTWQVENAPVQNQCTVAIFDERGFKVYEAKPYLNNWNGVSSRGTVLPAGVYYYVIKCDDSPSDFKAGSVNIVR